MNRGGAKDANKLNGRRLVVESEDLPIANKRSVRTKVKGKKVKEGERWVCLRLSAVSNPR